MIKFAKFLVIFSLIAISFSARGQDYDWVKFYQGSGHQQPISMQVDDAGNQYVTFNNHNGILILDSQTLSLRTILFKQDSSGNVLWYRSISLITKSRYTGILGSTFTSSGNFICLVAGNDKGVAIGNDTIWRKKPIYPTSGYWGVYLLEFNANGKLVYGNQLFLGYPHSTLFRGTTSNKLKTDKDDNLYISLEFADSLFIYDSNGVQLKTSINAYQNRVFKYSSAGKIFEWATVLPSSSTFLVSDMGIDIRGNTYLSVYLDYQAYDSTVYKSAGFKLPPLGVKLSGAGAVFILDSKGKGKNWFYLKSPNRLSFDNIAVHDTNSIFISGQSKGDSIYSDKYNYQMPDGKVYHFFARMDSDGNVAWLNHEDTSYVNTIG